MRQANFSIDKLYHLIAGLLIALLCGYLTSPLIGLVMGIIAGVGKELYDYTDYGEYDVYDALATWLGAVVGYGILKLL